MEDLHQNLIDGEWTGGDAIPNVNPSNTDEVVGMYARATAEDTQRAIAAVTSTANTSLSAPAAALPSK